jgi:hypothetical protein
MTDGDDGAVPPISAAGPPQGRLCEQGEAKARKARPRARVAAGEHFSEMSQIG